MYSRDDWVTVTEEQISKLRIFIGTTEIAGYYRNLAKGLDAIGLDYKYVQLSPNSSGYGTQSKLPIYIRLPYLLAKLRLKVSIEPGYYSVHKTKSGLLSLFRFVLYFFELFLRIFIVLPWAICKFDVFCFGARSNIVGIKAGYWDIALLKLFKKRIIYVYHGSDGRPPYINGSILHGLIAQTKDWQRKLRQLTSKTKNAVEIINRYADVIIDNPYSAHFQEKPFISWFSIGAPFCGELYQPESHTDSKINKKSIRILHAPTHRVSKGSAIIEACVKKLKDEGYDLELVLIHGRPHAEVIKEIQRCDFVIDELYSDALMAGFAAEASYYAKPVIVCGYVENMELQNKIPTHYCRPEALEDAVRKFVHEPEYRINLGQRAQEFIKNEWSYINIAKRYAKIFANQIPQEWYVQPSQISYVYGFGMPEQLLKESINLYIESEGTSALQLDDKPILRDAFLNFSMNN